MFLLIKTSFYLTNTLDTQSQLNLSKLIFLSEENGLLGTILLAVDRFCLNMVVDVVGDHDPDSYATNTVRSIRIMAVNKSIFHDNDCSV